MRLSVAIIARDEARHLGGCLTSVAGLADEVLVLLDSRTTDDSGAIAAHHGAQVQVEPWRGFPAQRNRALELCQGDWVLFLDADERVTPELATELRGLLFQDGEPRSQGAKERQSDLVGDRRLSQSPSLPVSPAQTAGYWIPRHNLFFGRVLRGGGWYPDYQLRLLRREAARYDEARLVHELVILDGEAGWLQAHLLHQNIESLGELWAKQSAYALAEARTLYREGRRARWRNLIGGPARELWRRYVALGGWRDGLIGLFMCATLAWFELVKFVLLWALAKPRPQSRAG